MISALPSLVGTAFNKRSYRVPSPKFSHTVSIYNLHDTVVLNTAPRIVHQLNQNGFSLSIRWFIRGLLFWVRPELSIQSSDLNSIVELVHHLKERGIDLQKCHFRSTDGKTVGTVKDIFYPNTTVTKQKAETVGTA